MRDLARGFFLLLAVAADWCVAARAQASWPAQVEGGDNTQVAAEQIFALANQARAQTGAGRLQWDPALAAAALYHCRRMAAEGTISHRYGGEADVSGRAAQAGAHFSLIEENVAVGPSAGAIHSGWMQSPGHRSNLLSPDVDHVGVAVVAARGVLYAVADYSRAVQQLSPAQIEARVAAMVRAGGVAIARDPGPAREACTMDAGMPRGQTDALPGFLMRWQDAELRDLPEALSEKLATGRYRVAVVGSCPAHGLEGSFSAYRVAVLLY